jgi:urease accessory protein
MIGRKLAGQHGSLELVLRPGPEGTEATCARAIPPLQLSRLRRDSAAWPAAACFTLVHLGGVLDGDRYDLTIDVASGAAATLASAAATLAHPATAAPAEIDITICVASGARLAYLPQPLILFRDADLRQRTRVVIAPGGLLLLAEVFVVGRLAMGERLAFRRYCARLEVCDPEGQLLVAERLDLQPAAFALDAPGLLGGASAVGSFYLLAPGRQLDALQAALEDALRDQGLDAALGPLPNRAGLFVRALGAEGGVLQRALADLAALAMAHEVLQA